MVFEIIKVIIEEFLKWMTENGEGVYWGLNIGSLIRLEIEKVSKAKKEAAKKQTASEDK